MQRERGRSRGLLRPFIKLPADECCQTVDNCVRTVRSTPWARWSSWSPPWEHLARVARPRAGRLAAGRRRPGRDGLLPRPRHEGRDAESLAELRERCADAPLRRAGARGRRRDDDGRDPLPRLSRRRAGARRAPRTRGLRLVCVSNWDCSLPEVLERCGLGDGLSTASSPRRAPARASPTRRSSPRRSRSPGCAPDEALHVGDTAEEDVAGARAAGMGALLLIDRDGGGDIASLAEMLWATWKDGRVSESSLPPPPPPPACPRPTAPPTPSRRSRRRRSEPCPAASWGPAQVLAGLALLLVATLLLVSV